MRRLSTASVFLFTRLIERYRIGIECPCAEHMIKGENKIASEEIILHFIHCSRIMKGYSGNERSRDGNGNVINVVIVYGISEAIAVYLGKSLKYFYIYHVFGGKPAEGHNVAF